MRTEDFKDYFALRQIADNPWEIVRFRKVESPGRTLGIRMRDGRSLELRSGTQDFHIFHRVFLRDEYELNQQGGAPGWGCVVDLGANVGLFATRVSRIADRVISYEPFPTNFEQLRRNTADWPEVETAPLAAAGEAGTVRLYRPRSAGMTGVHSLYPDAAHASPDFDYVEAITLDELFDRHSIDDCDLLKIDVEGAEYDILYAASSSTFERVHRIYGEYHNVRPDDPGTRIDALSSFLGDHGFDVRVVPKRKVNLGMFYAVARRD